MKFSDQERVLLLAAKGVGPKVIERLEQMNITNFESLARADAREILAMGAQLTGSSCWKNSPLARAAIEKAIVVAENNL